MMPLPYRWLTSLMMRYNGKSILIDCGEGTQIAMREKGWSPNPIDIICFTHFHADHISGLPGMLLTMGNAERTEPLLLIGPRGLTKVVASLRVIAPELPFEVKCIEITENAQTFSFEGFRLEAFRVNHNVLCYGYSMVIDRAGRFDKDRALEQEIPMKFWSRLQKGETLEENGRVFTPDMVLGAERKGLKVTYSTDTRPTESIRQNSKGSDLLILAQYIIYAKYENNSYVSCDYRPAREEFRVYADSIMELCGMRKLDDSYMLDYVMLSCFSEEEIYLFSEIIEGVE